MAASIQHLAALFLIQLFIDVFVVSFTKPSSLLRPACLPILLINVWLMLRSDKTSRPTHPMYPNLLGGSIFTLALQYFNLVLVRRSSYNGRGPTTTPEGKPLHPPPKKEQRKTKTEDTGDIMQRLEWGFSHLLDNRFAGFPWEVKNVPPFSKEDATYVPSKSTFIVQNTLRCLVSVLLIDLARPSADTSQNAVLFANEKIPFFSRLASVTTEDVAMRFITTIASTTLTYLLFTAMHTGAAVLCVALGLSDPKRWRPFFGDLSEAYSLRGAWGQFWHQGMASSLGGPAKWLVFGILRFPKSSLAARYLYTLVVFALSGAMHVCGEVAAGIPVSDSGALPFFATQALGLAIEDAAVAIWKGAMAPRVRRGSDEGGVRWWQKAVGFVWVVVWFAWSMPVWMYPASRQSEGEGLLPFSIIDHLK